MTACDHSSADWRKSSRSDGGGQHCVEVAFVADNTAVRDSKDPWGGHLVLPPDTWHQFADAVRSGSLGLF